MADNSAAEEEGSDAPNSELSRNSENPEPSADKDYGSTNADHSQARPVRRLSADRWVDLLFTAALTTATIVNSCTSVRQLGLASGQLSVMRDQQRAWIKADLLTEGSLQYINGIGVSFPFRFSLTNVGHYPAFNVRTLAFLYTPQAANEDVFAVWKKRCADWKTETDVNKTAGFVILPGENTPSDKFTSLSRNSLSHWSIML